MVENKKVKIVPDTIRPPDDSVGNVLHAARMAKKLSIDDVSVALRIRSVQLQAIEESNIDALPGMTYAVGFVRSYANFLGLDGVEIVHKFRAEHGHTPDQSKLSFPEPVAESRMPDPMMVGVGAFLAILVLVMWTFYSNSHNGAIKVAEQIPPAPVATTTSETPPEFMPAQTEIAPVDAAVIPAATPMADTIMPPQEQPATAAALPAVAEPPSEDTVSPVDGPADKKAIPAKVASTPAVKAPAKDDASVINIKRGKSRVMLQASQASWVQITDANQDVIYKRVLRPGEQYYVPDQPGLSLVTANAGGLDIYVDDQKVQSIGQPGEIVRGIVLEPNELKKKRVQIRN